ncbi:MAG: GNAT family N-acetyltransferase [Spirochaetales bacterium]|nr:GNAT family N-acetyltransferase [Spirochaetales bacterium]
MSESGIREALPSDNQALIELERACPQGSRLVMHSERYDYFYRAKLFGNHHTIVAVDHGRIFGVLAATLKKVLLGGEETTAAYFYDLRIHPDYRRTVAGRNMLKAWIELEKWAAESGAAIMYGAVKGDNEVMLGMQRKRNAYRFAGEMLIASRPVYKKKPVDLEPELVDLSRDGDELATMVFAEYGSRNLFPVELVNTCLTPPMRETGLFSCYRLRSGDSWASVGLYRICREIWMRVVKLPWYYRTARPVFETLRPVLPLPVVPRAGGEVRYFHVFNHLAGGPHGLALWKTLLSFVNNLAFAEGVTLVTGCFDPGDRFLPMFSRGAINTISYKTGYKPLKKTDREYSFSPFAPDVRDMD